MMCILVIPGVPPQGSPRWMVHPLQPDLLQILALDTQTQKERRETFKETFAMEQFWLQTTACICRVMSSGDEAHYFSLHFHFTRFYMKLWECKELRKVRKWIKAKLYNKSVNLRFIVKSTCCRCKTFFMILCFLCQRLQGFSNSLLEENRQTIGCQMTQQTKKWFLWSAVAISITASTNVPLHKAVSMCV